MNETVLRYFIENACLAFISWKTNPNFRVDGELKNTAILLAKGKLLLGVQRDKGCYICLTRENNIEEDETVYLRASLSGEIMEVRLFFTKVKTVIKLHNRSPPNVLHFRKL